MRQRHYPFRIGIVLILLATLLAGCRVDDPYIKEELGPVAGSTTAPVLPTATPTPTEPPRPTAKPISPTPPPAKEDLILHIAHTGQVQGAVLPCG